mmetsp:Transcript_423/g.936  ORF Transcript_423/g.936 Transcript_423/m.936 type:complete len:224 (-) Transcript_423:95-766(-)
MAIFIENVLAGAKTNEQIIKRQRLQDDAFFASKMTELVAIIMQVAHKQQRQSEQTEQRRTYLPSRPQELLQTAAAMEITPAILDEVRRLDGVAEIFSDLAIADEDIANLFDTLDIDASGTIDMEELFEGVAKLRGDARRSDIIAINLMLQKVYSELCELRQGTSSLFVKPEKAAYHAMPPGREKASTPLSSACRRASNHERPVAVERLYPAPAQMNGQCTASL